MVSAALYPWEPRWHATPAGRLHFVDEGEPKAPPILMLHGNPTWSFYYRDLIRELSLTHRAIALDHLGCGKSDKPPGGPYRLEHHIRNVESLVTALDLRDLTLVLHDWGGAIGMGFAVRHPERVKRFVILNTAAFLSDRIHPSLVLARLPVLGETLIRGLNAFSRVALSRAVVHHERITPEIRDAYLEPYGSWANRVAIARFVEDIPLEPGHPSRGTLRAIDEGISRFRSHPMLIAWGARDFVFDDVFLAEWRRRFPTARVERIEDAGHYVLEDAHERIIPWVRELLSS